MKAALLVIVAGASACSLNTSAGGDDLPADDCAGGCDAPTYPNTCGSQPTADETCTPGESCVYSDWEHSCSCGCAEDGHWACANDTIGSRCPTGGYSAFEGAFPLAELDTPLDETAPSISADSTELVFSRPGAGGDLDLWRATRAPGFLPFDPPAIVGSVSAAADETDPTLSRDGLVLYFTRGTTIRMATRPAPDAPWGTAAAVPALAGFAGADLSRDDVVLVAASTADQHLVEIGRAADGTLGPPQPIDLLAAPVLGSAPTMRRDGRELIFDVMVDGTRALYAITRVSRGDPWEHVQRVAIPGMDGADLWDPELSDDGLTLYFVSDVAGSADLYATTRYRE